MANGCSPVHNRPIEEQTSLVSSIIKFIVAEEKMILPLSSQRCTKTEYESQAITWKRIIVRNASEWDTNSAVFFRDDAFSCVGMCLLTSFKLSSVTVIAMMRAYEKNCILDDLSVSKREERELLKIY